MSTKKVFHNLTEWRNADGVLHREDGPAVEWDNGDTEWCKNGLYHRVDGPAIEYSDGYKAWYLNGESYTEEEHTLLTWEHLTQEKQDDIIFGKSDVD